MRINGKINHLNGLPTFGTIDMPKFLSFWIGGYHRFHHYFTTGTIKLETMYYYAAAKANVIVQVCSFQSV